MPRTSLLLPAVAAAVGLTVAGAGSAGATPTAIPAAARPAAAAASAVIVRGAILQRYEALGGPTSYLGAPLVNEAPTPLRFGAYQGFQGGSIYWSPASGAWDVHGAIFADWASLGFENSALGFPTSGENGLANGVIYQSFQGGLIYWSAATRAQEVRGAILGDYASLGWETSALGLPLSNELPTPDGVGRFEVFEHGSIYWTPATGAHEVLGAIRDKWGAIGYENSLLSYPVSDQVAVPGGQQSDFELGSITDNPTYGPYVSSFFAPVSSVDRAGSTFTVQLLQQSFSFDANDVFLRLPLGGTITGGSLPQPITLTKAEFTDDLGVDTFVIAKDYSLDPSATTTYEIIDIASVPKTAEGKRRLLRALR